MLRTISLIETQNLEPKLQEALANNENESLKRKLQENDDKKGKQNEQIEDNMKYSSRNKNDSEKEQLEDIFEKDGSEIENSFLNEEEKRLENLIFGTENKLLSNLDKIREKKGKKSENKRAKGLKFNQSKNDLKLEYEQESEPLSRNKSKSFTDFFEKRKPMWQDSNDQEIVDLEEYSQFRSTIKSNDSKVLNSQIEESLKSRFVKYYGTPIWADLDKTRKKRHLEEDADKDEYEEESEDLFNQTGNYLFDKNNLENGSLAKNLIDIKVCTDANKEEPHQARLKSVEFHPIARVMLTAGLGQKLTLFQIDGKKNSKIQTIFIEKFPILAAHFTRLSGDEIIMGSRHKSFYYYDMNSGKIISVTPPVKALDEFQRPSISSNFEISPDNKYITFVGSQGQIHLFSVKSKEWIDTLKINDNCNSITYSADSRYLFAFGDGKDVYVFDMNHRGHRSLHKFTDYGCLSGTSIAVSNNSQFIATGCKSGVVNIYNLNECLVQTNRHPKPIKSFMNLTTPCTLLKFNSTSEILTACSSYAEDACKLIHVGSMSVFSNFPIRQNDTSSSIRIPQCVDFSLNSGYLAIGNHKGNALLYRLKHYGSF